MIKKLIKEAIAGDKNSFTNSYFILSKTYIKLPYQDFLKSQMLMMQFKKQ